MTPRLSSSTLQTNSALARTCGRRYERASGYRYGQRAFLIQLKRDGDTIWLIDSEALKDGTNTTSLDEVEWILHAAIQDLPSLRQAVYG